VHGGADGPEGWPSGESIPSYARSSSRVTPHPDDDGVLLGAVGAVGAVRPGVADAVVSMCRMAPRSKRQQRHDAFTRGLQALLDNGVLGVRGKSAPHIAVTVDLDFAEGVPGSLPARTDHQARLSRQQIRQLLCRSTFTRLVLDAQHRVVQVSTPSAPAPRWNA